MSSAWPTISAAEGLTRLRAGARGLDVRSEGEFARGELPGFANVPILGDEHRHLVGLCYKERGQERAIELGHELVLPLRESLIARWRAVAPDMVVCWRGGLRSRITSEWLAEAGVGGVRVEGGFKAMRAELLAAFSSLPPLLVLSGLTGAGKTEFLRSLPASEYVDLEGLARHRGSAFGLEMDVKQPAQQTFENALGFAFWRVGDRRIVEDEGGLIGTCALPAALRACMLRSPVVVLDSTLEERVARTFDEYVARPLLRYPRGRVRQHLLDATERIGRRLGGLRLAALRRELFAAFALPEMSLDGHAGWISMLLTEYYDPQYEYGLKRWEREIVFRGDARAVREFLDVRVSPLGD